MNTKLDTRRIIVFLGFAFGIAWLTALIIYLNGGLAHSPQIAPGVSLAIVLMATAYMWAPALGNILTRLITHEGWKDMRLRPNFKKGWPFWLAGWFLPAVMTVFGAASFFLLFPQYFDATLPLVRRSMAAYSFLPPFPPWLFITVMLVFIALIAPLLNFLATFGEEFGWRAYLLPKLMPLGGRKATVLIGLIWGIWHWPVIFMGYEYGVSYPDYPWAGPLLFIWITFGLGTFLAWLTLRSRSVWPAVIGHAAINGIAGAAAMVMTGHPNLLLGPMPVGLIGTLGYALVTLAIFISPNALKE